MFAWNCLHTNASMAQTACGRRIIMVTTFKMSMKKRLECYGYKFVHLFRNVYLVQNDPTKETEIPIYGIAVLRKGK